MTAGDTHTAASVPPRRKLGRGLGALMGEMRREEDRKSVV